MPPRSTFCHRTITDSITRIVFGGAGTGEIHCAQYRRMQHRPLTMWSAERAATRTSPAAILSLWSPWTNAITSMSRPPTKSCDAAMIWAYVFAARNRCERPWLYLSPCISVCFSLAVSLFRRSYTLTITRMSTRFGDRCFQSPAARLWNRLPPSLRQPDMTYIAYTLQDS